MTARDLERAVGDRAPSRVPNLPGYLRTEHLNRRRRRPTREGRARTSHESSKSPLNTLCSLDVRFMFAYKLSSQCIRVVNDVRFYAWYKGLFMCPAPNLVDKWSASLGLLPIPIRPEDRGGYVLLNGATGNFCLDERSSDYVDNRNVAWSSNVGHYVSIVNDDVFVQRWDASINAAERFSLRSVESSLTEFHKYLEKSEPRQQFSAVSHAVRIFRQLRSAAQDRANGSTALRAFLVLLAAATENVDRGAVDCQTWGLNEGSLDAIASISEADWNTFRMELLRGRSLEGLVLLPDLLLRHAAGVLFQEAHYEAVVAPQLPFPGFAPLPARPTRSTASSGIHFTPPALARAIVEQALHGFDLTREAVTVLDPACGSGEFLREFVRQVRLAHYKGRLNLVGFDVSEPACEMARFVLAWEKRHDKYGVSVNIKRADSLAPELAWPREIDLLLMNPPFVSYEDLTPEQRDTYTSVLGKLARGRFDYSTAFIWKAAQSLAPRGVIGTLTPASFLEAKSTQGVRGEIASRLNPTLIARLGSNALFTSATVDVAAFVASASPVDDTPLAFWADHRPSSTASGLRVLRQMTKRMKSTQFPVEGDGFSIYPAPGLGTQSASWAPRSYAAWRLLQRLTGLPMVRDLFTVRTGARPGLNSAFIVDKSYWCALPDAEQKFFRPAVVNESISAGYLVDSKYAFYPYGQYRIADESVLTTKLKKFYKDRLLPNRTELLRRSSRRKANWWEMSEPRSWQFRREPKIVSVYFGQAGSFAFDESGDFVVVQGFAWIPRFGLRNRTAAAARVSFAYLAILNSSLINELLSATSNPVRGGQWDLSARYVENIRIPDLSRAMESTALASLADIGRRIHRGTDVARAELDESVAALFGISDYVQEGTQKISF